MLDKVHVYMWLHTASIKSADGNKTGLFSCPLHSSTSSRLTSAGTIRSDYVAASGSAFRSATQENESGG